MGVGAPARTAWLAGHGWNTVDQRQDLGDVVDDGRGGDDLEQGAVTEQIR
jgi:hypothetical protein